MNHFTFVDPYHTGFEHVHKHLNSAAAEGDPSSNLIGETKANQLEVSSHSEHRE